MKALPSLRRLSGFTLIELLVVIAIIGLLAGLLLPTLAAVKRRSQISTARLDIRSIELAISQYENEYSRLPGNTLNPPTDRTFGPVVNAVQSDADVMATLLGVPQGINAGNAKNPKQTTYYKAPRTSSEPLGASRAGSPPLDQGSPGVIPGTPGLSTVDYQLRDPWGTPYVISLDLNYDGKTQDSFYQDSRVSEVAAGNPNGLNGLISMGSASPASFAAKGPAMIWSFGPDKLIELNKKADQGANKDNILSWYSK